MGTVLLRSHGRTAGLGWLALGVCLGAPLVAVGLQPGGKPINLWIGVPVFGFFVVMAVWELGHSTALRLDPEHRRGLFRARWLHRRRQAGFGFEEVARLVLVRSTVTTSGRNTSTALYYDLRLELHGRPPLTPPLGRRHDAEDLAVRAGRALGLRVDQERLVGHGP